MSLRVKGLVLDMNNDSDSLTLEFHQVSIVDLPKGTCLIGTKNRAGVQSQDLLFEVLKCKSSISRQCFPYFKASSCASFFSPYNWVQAFFNLETLAFNFPTWSIAVLAPSSTPFRLASYCLLRC